MSETNQTYETFKIDNPHMYRRWQSIDTAPNDGSRVLLYRAGYAEPLSVGWWSRDWMEWSAPLAGTVRGATHWMPLPELPK